MVIASTGLPDLLRYTILDAYRYCMFSVLNEPRCVIKRASAINDLVWRNYSPSSITSWYHHSVFTLPSLDCDLCHVQNCILVDLPPNKFESHHCSQSHLLILFPPLSTVIANDDTLITTHFLHPPHCLHSFLHFPSPLSSQIHSSNTRHSPFTQHSHPDHPILALSLIFDSCTPQRHLCI